jgi:Fe-S cluster assembly protein SufD
MNAEAGPIRTAAEQALAAAFKDARERLPGGEDVARRREQAHAAFVEGGLPHRRQEAWKYTDLRALVREAPPLASPPDTGAIARARASNPLPGVEARRIVLVDGAFVPELSDLAGLEKGLTLVPLAQALAEGHGLAAHIGALKPDEYDAVWALNTAFLNDGVLIDLAEGAAPARPIYVRHVFTGAKPAASYARAVMRLGAGARATVIESFEGPDRVAYQVNSGVELHLADRSRAAFVRLQADGDAALHLSRFLVHVGSDAELSASALTMGAAIARHTVEVRMAGERSNARLSGATLLRGRQHADTTLLLDHSGEACQSRALFKSVLDHTSRGIVQGRILVRPAAQKTDARMMLGGLLLAEGAEADHKPELEIFADDVQCGHGATSGALDEQLLFYLLARGIPRRQAEALLIQAFYGEALEAIEREDLREALSGRAGVWLAEREGAP